MTGHPIPDVVIPPCGITADIRFSPGYVGGANFHGCTTATMALVEVRFPSSFRFIWSSPLYGVHHWIWAPRRTCTVPAIFRACARGGQAHPARYGNTFVTGMTVAKRANQVPGFPREAGMTKPNKPTSGSSPHA